MDSLATAFYTASLALVGKVGFDVWSRFRERQGVAASLAGEVGAFAGIMMRNNSAQNFRGMKQLNSSDRQERLPAMNKAPFGFPVFDKVADKLGNLDPDLAEELSEFYNAFASFRIIFNNMSETAFVSAPFVVQDAVFEFAAGLLDKYASNLDLRDKLRKISDQSFSSWFFNGARSFATTAAQASSAAFHSARNSAR